VYELAPSRKKERNGPTTGAQYSLMTKKSRLQRWVGGLVACLSMRVCVGVSVCVCVFLLLLLHVVVPFGVGGRVGGWVSVSVCMCVCVSHVWLWLPTCEHSSTLMCGWLSGWVSVCVFCVNGG